MPQQDTLDTELTVRENLVIYGRYFGLQPGGVRAAGPTSCSSSSSSPSAPNDQVEPLSGGMKRRLTIARALINEPDLLLLDEPTTGLDPQARHLLWDRLYRLKQRGVTLVLTTHYMDEAEQLCDRLVVMDKAKIVAEGSPAPADRAATRRARSSSCASRRASRRRSTASSTGSPSGSSACPTGCCSTPTTARRPSPRRTQRGLQPETVLVRRSTLEDVFLRLTGRSLVE